MGHQQQLLGLLLLVFMLQGVLWTSGRTFSLLLVHVAQMLCLGQSFSRSSSRSTHPDTQAAHEQTASNNDPDHCSNGVAIRQGAALYFIEYGCACCYEQAHDYNQAK